MSVVPAAVAGGSPLPTCPTSQECLVLTDGGVAVTTDLSGPPTWRTAALSGT